MNEHKTLEGEWWLPNSPNFKIKGTLVSKTRASVSILLGIFPDDDTSKDFTAPELAFEEIRLPNIY